MAENDPTPEPAQAPSAPTPEPAANAAPLETSKAKMDRLFNDALMGSESRSADPSTDEPAADPKGEAKQGDEKSEAKTEEAPAKTEEPKAEAKTREYDFGGNVGIVEIPEDSPLRGSLDKLQTEIRYRRQEEGRAKAELADARKELEAAKATKPEPAEKQAAAEPPTDDVDAIAAELADALDIDDAAAAKLAKRIAARNTFAPSPADDPRITAALARLERMEAILGDDLDKREAEMVRSEATAHVAAHVKEAHGVDLAPEQVEAVRDRAQELLDAAKIPDGTPEAAAAIIVRQCVDLAYAEIAKTPEAKPAEGETKKPTPPSSKPRLADLVKDRKPAPAPAPEPEPARADNNGSAAWNALSR